MATQSQSVLGSGTVPFTLAQPVPIPGDSLVYRQGDNVVVINPEDFSVHRDATTQLVNVSTSVIRIDKGLTNRRAVAIANTHESAILYIGFSDNITTSAGSTGAWTLFGRNSMSIDCSNRIHIYAVTTGSTILASVMEIA